MVAKKEPALTVEFMTVPTFRKAKRIFEAAYASYLLKSADGNLTAAARHAGKDRKDFYDLVRRSGVKPEDFRK